MPSIGLTVPGRVCDRCFYDSNGLVSADTVTATKVERIRERRNVIVDDLAAQVKGAPLIFS